MCFRGDFYRERGIPRRWHFHDGRQQRLERQLNAPRAGLPRRQTPAACRSAPTALRHRPHHPERAHKGGAGPLRARSGRSLRRAPSGHRATAGRAAGVRRARTVLNVRSDWDAARVGQARVRSESPSLRVRGSPRKERRARRPGARVGLRARRGAWRQSVDCTVRSPRSPKAAPGARVTSCGRGALRGGGLGECGSPQAWASGRSVSPWTKCSGHRL